MTTQTQITRNLPPGYVTTIGEQFTDFFMGGMPVNTTDITQSPFYADPNAMFGGTFNPATNQFTGITGANVPASDFFVAGQDAMQTDAQAIATGQQAAPTAGLGQYQSFLDDASALNQAAMGSLGTFDAAGNFTQGPVSGQQALVKLWMQHLHNLINKQQNKLQCLDQVQEVHMVEEDLE